MSKKLSLLEVKSRKGSSPSAAGAPIIAIRKPTLEVTCFHSHFSLTLQSISFLQCRMIVLALCIKSLGLMKKSHK